MKQVKRWLVIEVVEFSMVVEATTRQQAKEEQYSMRHADTATTIKFTAKPLKEGKFN